MIKMKQHMNMFRLRKEIAAFTSGHQRLPLNEFPSSCDEGFECPTDSRCYVVRSRKKLSWVKGLPRKNGLG